MAKYNREFLVPYLQNICALHLAYNKLDKKINEISSEDLPYLKWGKSNPKPKEPEVLDTFSGGGFASLVIGSIMLALIIFAFSSESETNAGDIFILFFGISLCLLMIYIPIHSIKGRMKRNEYEQLRYQHNMAQYEEIAEYNKKLRTLVPVYEAKFEYYKKERDNIDILLDQAYDVNVIPRRYRDIYAAVYLYDWFSTSQADNLDMALSMFVLEEIKEKLDTIIVRQSESILNQRIMLATQQKSLEQQQRYSSMMYAKLNKMAASNEERNIYLSMIESNTAASAYFAAAEYISSL